MGGLNWFLQGFLIILIWLEKKKLSLKFHLFIHLMLLENMACTCYTNPEVQFDFTLDEGLTLRFFNATNVNHQPTVVFIFRRSLPKSQLVINPAPFV